MRDRAASWYRAHDRLVTWLIIALGVAGTIVAIIWAGSTYDALGHPLLDADTSAVIVGLIGLVATLAGLVLHRTGQVKEQVTNAHNTNLRDDVDGARAESAQQHDAVMAQLDGLGRTIDVLAEQVAGTASDVRGMRRDIGRNTERIDRLQEGDSRR